jgi:hypothetical protein
MSQTTHAFNKDSNVSQKHNTKHFKTFKRRLINNKL